MNEISRTLALSVIASSSLVIACCCGSSRPSENRDVVFVGVVEDLTREPRDLPGVVDGVTYATIRVDSVLFGGSSGVEFLVLGNTIFYDSVSENLMTVTTPNQDFWILKGDMVVVQAERVEQEGHPFNGMVQALDVSFVIERGDSLFAYSQIASRVRKQSLAIASVRGMSVSEIASVAIERHFSTELRRIDVELRTMMNAYGSEAGQ